MKFADIFHSRAELLNVKLELNWRIGVYLSKADSAHFPSIVWRLHGNSVSGYPIWAANIVANSRFYGCRCCCSRVGNRGEHRDLQRDQLSRAAALGLPAARAARKSYEP